MPYATRFFAVIDFFTLIVWHMIQREYRYNMVSVDVGVVRKVKCIDSKKCYKDTRFKLWCFSISIVEVKEKQSNDNDPMIFSIKLFGEI